MTQASEYQPHVDIQPVDWDAETLEMLGPDGRGIGAFTFESLGPEEMFWNGVAMLAVTAATVAVGIKLAREVLGR